jgi:hypothetical protein
VLFHLLSKIYEHTSVILPSSASANGQKASIAMAVIGPIPGMDISRAQFRRINVMLDRQGIVMSLKKPRRLYGEKS